MVCGHSHLRDALFPNRCPQSCIQSSVQMILICPPARYAVDRHTEVLLTREKVPKGSYTWNRNTQLLFIRPGGGLHDRRHHSHWPDRPSSAEQPARERRADPRDRTRSLAPSRTPASTSRSSRDPTA